jgi:diguanylate cyclase (GGDEF)-like protein
MVKSGRRGTDVPLQHRLLKQAGLYSVLIITGLLCALTIFGGWAAKQIDQGALERQKHFVISGLSEIAERLPVDQDGIAIWNDAVSALQTNDQIWLKENMVEWSASFFDHDRVYILDANEEPVRSVVDQELRSIDAFAEDRTALQPLIARLRQDIAKSSEGLQDSTSAITGMGILDFVRLANGHTSIVGIRPVIPFNDAITQRPGTEFLLISMIYIDDQVLSEVGHHFELTGLKFSHDDRLQDGLAVEPLLDKQGRIVGYFSWVPDQPASELIVRTGWVLLLVVVATALAMITMSELLKQTSVKLQSSEAEAQFLAFHDPLARIPNRALFEDRLVQGLQAARRSNSNIAVFSIDLDHFKRVNDTLGHPAGDELIREAARRMQVIVGEEGTVARIGGDEFAIVQNTVSSLAAAEHLAQEIITSLEYPFDLSGHEACVGASIGIVLVTDASETPEDILRHADMALYEAKESGRGKFCVFAGELGTAIRERRALEIDLRDAVRAEDNGGLELFYQPIFDTRTGMVCGAEALLRWNHPKHGQMSPAMFIPLAEERGVIDLLGYWVLRQAATHALVSKAPWIAVNVSPLQFKDERFGARVLGLLADVGLDPSRLEIEITEGLLLQNSPVVQATLQQLRAAGIRIALDDFGTGYSSISYLRSHGVDKLKIDQSFVHQLGSDPDIEGIVRSIIDLARAMHMRVTAEGVETVEQQRFLRGMGCDQLQGFLLSRPLPQQTLEHLLIEPGSAA